MVVGNRGNRHMFSRYKAGNIDAWLGGVAGWNSHFATAANAWRTRTRNGRCGGLRRLAVRTALHAEYGAEQ